MELFYLITSAIACLMAIAFAMRATRVERRAKKLSAELEAANVLLREQARIDELTGLANLREFEERLGYAWSDHARTGHALSLVKIDLDRFEWFNEHHGRAAGDKALHAVAQAMRGVVERPTDLLARCGGDKMVALLPNTDTEGAEFVAEAMAEEVRKLRLPHDECAYGVLTVSVGVASVSPEAETGKDTLLEAVETALQQAKTAGRDRVYAAS
ncbi:GGDEF domain-containing protein [Halioglobus maricola]|nr:diguanylate cyclase [Halioglobus maricola]